MKLTKLLLACSPLASLLVGAMPTPALAETWIAKCNNVQFNFQRDSDRFLVYFQTDTGTYQIAQGEIAFDNGTALRGPVQGNDAYIGAGGGSNQGEPITQIGLNPSRNLVYVFYQHPRNNSQKTGKFCNTEIRKQGGSSSARKGHTLVIDSKNVPGSTHYTIKTSEGLKQVEGELDGRQVTIQSKRDRVIGNEASGRVSNGRDGFRFKGELLDIQLSNPDAANVYIDGERRAGSGNKTESGSMFERVQDVIERTF